MNVGMWEGAAVLVKAVLYAATLSVAGSIFFLGYSRSFLEPADRLAITRPLYLVIAVAIVASAARVLIIAASLSESAAGMLDSRLLALVCQSGEGAAALVRVLGVLLALPALVRRGRPGWLAIGGATAAATSFAWVGHARAAPNPAAPWLLAIHLLAAAFWLGALAPLSLLARRREPRTAGAAAARFGRIALALVGILLAAGIAVICILLGSVAELWTSAYGRIACTKLGLVACLLALAAGNKLELVPRMAAGEVLAVSRLRQSIRAEMVVAALILLATAALTTLAGPPRME